MLLKLKQLRGKCNFLLEEVLGIEIVLGGIVGVLLNVQTDGGAGRTSAREADDNAAARGEAGKQTLVGGDGAVKIGVGEVAGTGNSAASNGAANEGRVGHELGKLTNDLVSALRVDIFIVVAGEEGTAVLGPEVLLDLLN